MIVLLSSSKRISSLPHYRTSGLVRLTPGPVHHHRQLAEKHVNEFILRSSPVSDEDCIHRQGWLVTFFSSYVCGSRNHESDRKTGLYDQTTSWIGGFHRWSDFVSLQRARYSPSGTKIVTKEGSTSKSSFLTSTATQTEISDAEELNRWITRFQSYRKGVHSLSEAADSTMKSKSIGKPFQDVDNGPIVSDDNEIARTSYCCGSINISNSHLNVKKVGKTESNSHLNVKKVGKTELLAKDEDSMVSQSVPKGGVSELAQRSEEEEFQDIKMVTCTGKLGEPLLGRIKEKGNLRTHAYQSMDIEVPEIHRKQTNKSLGTFSIDLMDTRVIDAAIKEVEYQHIGESKVLRLPPECSSKDSSARDLYIILDLNGVLIKRWDKHPGLPCVSKLNKKWIQLRPGCINFLCNIFSKFKVGIWSTMTRKNTVGICKLIEQQAHQRLPFFMLWDKDFCYQHKGVGRPEKPHVPADFKPLSHVWNYFKPNLGSHNTILIDDSPYKACMNNPYNCIFPYPFEGCEDDDYLNSLLLPYLETMRMAQDIQGYIANNPLGQQPIGVGHQLYYHVQQVMNAFHKHVRPANSVKLLIGQA